MNNTVRVRILAMDKPGVLFEHTVSSTQAVCVHTRGFIPLGLIHLDATGLSIWFRDAPSCILQDREGALWVCASAPYRDETRETVWQRADAVAEQVNNGTE